jgi:DNA-binding transcriptional LysR family regulator
MLPVDEKEFDVIPFVNEELSLFVHTTHPLAHREKVELSELKNENFILFNQELIYNLIIQEFRHIQS